MELTDTQKEAVASWFASGASLDEIQKRIKSEFGLHMTYLDVRLMVAELPQPEETEVADRAGRGDAGEATKTTRTPKTPRDMVRRLSWASWRSWVSWPLAAWRRAAWARPSLIPIGVMPRVLHSATHSARLAASISTSAFAPLLLRYVTVNIMQFSLSLIFLTSPLVLPNGFCYASNRPQ